MLLLTLEDAVVVETLRTPERQAFLYGFGRYYDDGRGTVTNAASSLCSWHGYGLAADVVHSEKLWNAGDAWFTLMGETAEALGLVWGGRWKCRDCPHLQWGTCGESPSASTRLMMRDGGMKEVWSAVGAD